VIINKANLAGMFTAFKTAFRQALTTTPAQWQKVATLVPSTTKEEKYAWLGQWPRLRKWVGDRVIKSLAAHDYTLKNEKFESTVSVPRDDIEDDVYGVFTPLFSEMGNAAATHPDELVFALLTSGFSAVCYDGQYFFDTDHPVGNDETGITSVSNMQSGAGNPWYLLDTSRSIKPLIFQRRRDYNLNSLQDESDQNVFMRDEYLYGIDARVNAGFGLWQLAFGSKATLDEANYDAAVAAMMAFKSDEGRPIGIKPNLLVCGPSNRAAAKKVIEKATLANGEDNHNYKDVEVLVVPWLE